MSRTILVAALLALATTLALCAEPLAAKQRPLFPVTIRAANGAVTIAKRPVRVVSLSPTATEQLFAIGAGRQVVAVDELSNYPRRAPRTRLSGFRPNAEAIAAYRPDLVVVHSESGVAELERLGIKVLQLPAATTLAGAYRQIEQLGRATGHRKLAATVTKRMRARINTSIRSVQRHARTLSVYHELTTDFYSVKSRTFIGQVYRLFGLRNIADAAGGTSDYPQLSGEYIISANPDLIVLADSKCCGQRLATVATRPGWATISAVRNRRVVAADDDVASRWGPRIVQFVQSVAAAVRRTG